MGTSSFAPEADATQLNEQGDPESSDRALRGLFGRDSLYLILWAIQIVLAALLTPVETRLLGPASFGVVAAAVAVMQLLVQVGSFNLQTAIARAYTRPNGEENARRLVVLAIGMAGTLFILAYATGPAWCDAIGLGRFSTPIRYAVMWAALTAVTNATFGVLRSRDQLGWFATVSMIQSVVAEAVAVALMLLVRRDPAEYLLGQMLCQGLAVVVGLIAARPRLPRIADFPVLGDALRFTAPLVPAAVAAFAFDVSDRLVIHADIGSAATARYAVARNIGGFAIILLSVLQNAWMPRLFALKDATVRRTVMAASRDGIYALVACFALAITLAAPVLLLIWVPGSFRPSGLVLVSGIIAVSAIPAAGGQSSIRVLLLNERSTPVAVAMVLGAAVNLALNVAIVPWLGIYGSALSTLIAYSLMLLLLDIRARKVMALRRPSMHLLMLVAATSAVGLGSTALPWDPWTIVLRFVLALVAGLVFLTQFARMVAPERLTALVARLPLLRFVIPADSSALDGVGAVASDSPGHVPLAALNHPLPTAIGEVKLEKRLVVKPIGMRDGVEYRDQLLLARLHGEPVGLIHIDAPPNPSKIGRVARAIWVQAGAQVAAHAEAAGCIEVPEGPADIAAGLGGKDRCPGRKPQRPAGQATVIVATTGRPDVLRRTLESLLALRCEDFDVVVVDNRPGQGDTAALVAEFDGPIAVRYLAQPIAGAAIARNTGVAAAAASTFVAFTDDDVIVDKHWLSWMLAPFCEDGVEVSTGLVLPLSLDSPDQKRFETYAGFGKGFTQERYDLKQHRAARLLYPFWGGIFGSGNSMAFRREALVAVGGFDPALGPARPASGGEDLAAFTDVVLRGGRLVYEPRAVCWHEHRASEEELIRQVRSYGVGLTATLWRFARRDRRFWIAAVRSLPLGFRLRRERQNARADQTLPADLLRIEQRGMWVGPWRYAAGRREVKRLGVDRPFGRRH